ncbi:hypothetical protein KVT40_003213 [Elsinoe batatas]|uniref:Apple domain-containing protein n=1 Tax=Elsinoe batatas TaxID=2601811 RepID=A0A8K0LBT5_9PEZI|nr:hypothetical protein KVT40_003213 [Elsinoe batatas]
MRFWDAALPALAFTTVVEAQGIQFGKIMKKKPGLSQTTNTPAAETIPMPPLRQLSEAATATAATSATKKGKLPKVTTKKGKAPKTTKTKKAKAAKATGKSKTGHGGAVAAFAAVRPNIAAAGCVVQDVQYGYVPSPNNPTGFLTDAKLAKISKDNTPYPAGYTTNFTNQYGSLFANNYITYTQLPTYNISQCAAFCDATSGCQAFNIYFERDPIQDPGSACPNPTSSTMIRCALWGSQVSTSQAGNIGEWRTDFMVVVQGSNGYNKNPTPATVSGFNAPIPLGGASFTPQLCADFCTNTTATNKATARTAGLSSYTPCNFFNALSISVNGVAQGTYCQAYSSDVSSYAGLYSSTMSGVSYDLLQSYGYVASQLDSGVISSAAGSVVSSAAGNVVATANNLLPTTTAVRTTTTITSTAIPTTTTTTTRPLSAATPSSVSCTSLGGASYTDANGVIYQTRCGTDLLNVGDISSLAVNAYSDCFTNCDVISGCSGFAYVPSAKVCYFKRLVGVTTSPNANSNVDLAWLASAYTPPNLSSSSTTTTTRASTTTAAATTTAAGGLGAVVSRIAGSL